MREVDKSCPAERHADRDLLSEDLEGFKEVMKGVPTHENSLQAQTTPRKAKR